MNWIWAVRGISTMGLAAGLLTLAACSSSNKNAPTSAATNTPAGGSPTATAASTKPSPTATSSTADAFEQLSKDSNNFIQADYKITYTMSATESGKPVSGTLTMAHQGTNDAFTLTGDLTGEGTPGTVTIIETSSATYFCTDQPTKQCLKTGAGSSSQNPLSQGFNTIKPDAFIKALTSQTDVKVSSTAGRTIAGRSTKCYSVTSPDGNGTVCFDQSTGLMLFAQISGGSQGDYKLEATSVGQPSSSDFNPPYSVVSLGS